MFEDGGSEILVAIQEIESKGVLQNE